MLRKAITKNTNKAHESNDQEHQQNLGKQQLGTPTMPRKTQPKTLIEPMRR
jgi:hypothetical protein